MSFVDAVDSKTSVGKASSQNILYFSNEFLPNSTDCVVKGVKIVYISTTTVQRWKY